MKITPCKKAGKPSLPPSKFPRDIQVQHLAGRVIAPIQSDLKYEVSSWLEALHKGRAWLAEQCRVTPKTVDRWLMPWTRIPAARKKQLEELMKQFLAPRRD